MPLFSTHHLHSIVKEIALNAILRTSLLAHPGSIICFRLHILLYETCSRFACNALYIKSIGFRIFFTRGSSLAAFHIRTERRWPQGPDPPTNSPSLYSYSYAVSPFLPIMYIRYTRWSADSNKSLNLYTFIRIYFV